MKISVKVSVFALTDLSVIIYTKYKNLGPLEFGSEWVLLFASVEKDSRPYKLMFFFYLFYDGLFLICTTGAILVEVTVDQTLRW